MNKKLIWLIPILLILGVAAYLIFFNHSKDSKHTQFIQKTSNAIIKINPKSLYEKINEGKGFEEGEINKLFDAIEKDRTSKVFNHIVKKMRKDPLSVGLDLRNDVFFFTPNFDDVNCYAISISISDIDAFNRMILKMKDIESNLRKTEDFYIIKENESLCYTWNEKGLLILYSSPVFSFYSHGASESVEVYANQLMNLEEESTFNNSKIFNSWVKTNHDLSVFNNMVSSATNEVYVKIFKSLGLTNDEFASANHIDFEKKRVFMSSEYYGNTSFVEKFKILNNSKVSEKYISMVARENPILLMGANINIKSISQMLIDALEDYKDGFKELEMEVGMDVSKLEQYFTGDICFAVEALKMADVKVIEDPSYQDLPYSQFYRDVSQPVFNLAIGIKNKAVIKDFLAKFELTPLGEDRFIAGNIYFIVRDDFLFVSNDIENANKIYTEGYLIKDVNLKKELISNPLFGYMNLKLSKIENIDKFEGLKMIKFIRFSKVLKASSHFDYLELKSDSKFNGTAEIVMNPTDEKSSNSLQALLRLAVEMND